MNKCSKQRVIFGHTLFILLLLSLKAYPNEPIQIMTAPQQHNLNEVQLGKKLFHSTKLSSNDTISCASCHNLQQGADDGLAASIGINNQKGVINAPSIFNSVLDIAQFWDGRVANLKEQVEGPIHNPKEMGSNWEQVIKKLTSDSDLVAQFTQVYNSGISKETISSAIATYESQLITLNAPFDQYLRGNNDAITDASKEGYKLFKSMGCISCHQGQNVGGNMYQKFGVMGDYFADRGDIKKSDYGRYNITGRERDKFKFKVPSLRNVADTAPYFHDGSASTLEAAVRTMAQYQLGRPISENQVFAITEFLKTLTGEIDKELLP